MCCPALGMALCQQPAPGARIRAPACNLPWPACTRPGLRALMHGVEGETRARIAAWYTQFLHHRRVAVVPVRPRWNAAPAGAVHSSSSASSAPLASLSPWPHRRAQVLYAAPESVPLLSLSFCPLQPCTSLSLSLSLCRGASRAASDHGMDRRLPHLLVPATGQLIERYPGSSRGRKLRSLSRRSSCSGLIGYQFQSITARRIIATLVFVVPAAAVVPFGFTAMPPFMARVSIFRRSLKFHCAR